MKFPNLNEEKKLWKKGIKIVAGLDEAGRGPLAGPVVAAVVVLKISNFPGRKADSPEGCFSISKQIPNPKSQISKELLEVRDSKQLTAKKREEIYKLITKNKNIEWGIGKVSEKVIDRINIFEATKLAMARTIASLKIKPDFLILDGNFKIDSKIPQKSIVKADQKVFSCSAASIIAKVTRDRIMEKYDKKYPRYGFKKHKGYPTKFHFEVLRKFGPCKIHRKSFSPVKNSC